MQTIVIIARNANELKELFLRLERRAEKMGLKINESKTKYMKITRKETNNADNIRIEKYQFAETSTFKYLGTLMQKQQC